MKGLKRLLLLAAIGWLGCGGPPPKPGCSPGSSAPIVALCRADMAMGTASLEDCDRRVESWQTACLR